MKTESKYCFCNCLTMGVYGLWRLIFKSSSSDRPLLNEISS